MAITKNTFILVGRHSFDSDPCNLTYIYTQSLIAKHDKFQRKGLIHLIPSILTFIGAIPYLMLSREDKILMFEDKMELPDIIFIFSGFLVLFIGFYIYHTLKLINKHKKDIHQEFSYDENIDLTWLKNLVITMSILSVLIVAGIVTLKFTGETLVQSDFISYTYLVVFVYGIGYWGYKQREIFVLTYLKEC